MEERDRRENFNGEFRDEWLALERFRLRRKGSVLIKAWRNHCSEVSPASSLQYLTPAQFKQQPRQDLQPAVFQENCLEQSRQVTNKNDLRALTWVNSGRAPPGLARRATDRTARWNGAYANLPPLAASELLHFVLGSAGQHTRTSVGVYQLPKNASVELDLIAAARA